MARAISAQIDCARFMTVDPNAGDPRGRAAEASKTLTSQLEIGAKLQ
jgi:hypothetical protein